MKAAKLVVRILGAAIAYIVGTVVMGMLAPVLHLPELKALPGASPQQYFFMLVLWSPLLILGLLPLAWHLKGSWVKRCLVMAALIYVTLGLNTLIEAKVFSNVLAGSPLLASIQWILPSLMMAAVITYKFGDTSPSSSTMDVRFGQWAWRLGAAWLAFPVIYLIFGMCVAPVVVPYYNSGADALGLKIPSFAVMIQTQLVRSAILLSATVPVVLLWAQSRVRLFFALGLAHAITIGIFQLAQASFMPMVLRVAHSAEITADSFAYAAAITLLLTESKKRSEPAVKGTAAAAD